MRTEAAGRFLRALVPLCAAAAWAVAGAPETRSLEAVYHEGASTRLIVADTPRLFAMGPWRIGGRVVEKPKDQRLNLYIVAPGTQYHSELNDDFDHNVIVNALPLEGRSREYDVYWAAVLDPALKIDFRHERDLLLAAGTNFTPGDLFDVEDVPAGPLLRTFLKVDSLAELARFRRGDGTLPRMVILPAGFAIAASAPPAAPATQ